MNKFDYIIAGGGCAGLSLAYNIVQTDLKDKRVLIIDADQKRSNDRTWAFWSKHDTLFDAIVSKKWNKLSFFDDERSKKENIAPYTYRLIQGLDFYKFVKKELAAHANVTFLEAYVSRVGEDQKGAFVWADGQRYTAEWVFDSCFTVGKLANRKEGAHFLLQHFLGWRVKLETPAFNTDEAILMDFRAPQDNDARFFYLLPFSEKEALVEFTLFSDRLLDKKAYRSALEGYLSKHYAEITYTIEEEEFGVIPMTDQTLTAETDYPHVVQIGTKAGMVKPTTGYAFLNIQKQVSDIVSQLQGKKSTSLATLTQSRFRFYDRLLLNILQEDGREAKGIFSKLFHRNRITTILTFLGEKSTIWQEARIFASLPTLPFLKALFKVYIASFFNSPKPKAQLNQAK
ncbi:MAG: lycopene cyclase family protein [Bacteroidota bacterium]